MNRKIVLAFLTLIFIFSSCDDFVYDYGYVNFAINPESTEYYNLNTGNRGWEYFEGGLRGVVVFRINYGEYIAFERSCTEDNCHGRLDVDETSNMLLVCNKCNSQFIYVDGSPTSNSKAKRSLYQYCTHFDGTDLMVYNCN
ncbi:MAG: hypothetical protein LBM25_05920 [Bacteroidales bacterium]|jgi:nitrite reductase/ring-hydroxylating ferredoxin subunit|nr:hypothetical protein [Bacteroidales bacterium]